MAKPEITSSLMAGGNKTIAFSYQITASNSPTSFNASISPSGLPPGLTIDTVTGILSGTPSANGIWGVHISATNVDGTDTETLNLHIVQKNGVFIVSEPLATGTQGQPFTYQIIAGGNGLPATSFNATLLPAGLIIDTGTGLISGTPSVTGTFSDGDIVATNASGSDTLRMTFVLAAATGTVPVITSPTSGSGLVGEAFSYQITATNTPTSFDATPLPAGVSVNLVSGLISGTPTAVGVTVVGLSATNGDGTGTATLSINIQAVGTVTPPDLDIPKGVISFTQESATPSLAVRQNADVVGISLSESWSNIETIQDTYDFDAYFGKQIRNMGISKKLLLRINTSSGFKSAGGKIPDYVASLMGVSPTDKHIVPGVTYSYDPTNNSTLCAPVFWEPNYHARRVALYQAFGDWLTTTTTLNQAQKDQISIIGISYANIRGDGFNIPHRTNVVGNGGPDGTGYPLSELNRWLHLTGDVLPGAGYTTQKMIDIAINDDNDGLIDVVMNAFPGKFITHITGSNGPDLDSPNDQHYLCRTIYDLATDKYPNRFIIQRNDVSNIIPSETVSVGTLYELMGDEAEAGKPVAGQNLAFIWGDTTDTGGNGYQMNGGVDTDPDGILPPPLTASQIYRSSSRKIASYGAFFDEVYERDVLNQLPEDTLYVAGLFGATGSDAIVPVLTSALTLTMSVGQTLHYQITADNDPTSFDAVVDRAQPADCVTAVVSTVNGDVTLTANAPGTCEILIYATNDAGTDVDRLVVTVDPVTGGGGGSGSAPPPPAILRVDAFPEQAAFNQDDRDACPDYLAKLNQGPPSAVLDLIVITPQRPNSGTATATWKPPRKL